MIKKIINLLKQYFKNTYFLSFLLLKPKPNKNWNLNEYSDSHLYKSGEEYQKKFTSFQGRSIIWSLEQKILNNFIKEKNFNSHLDFAAGSGRVAIIFNKFVKYQYLIDISSSMLESSKEQLKNSKIINEDFRKNISLKDKKFNLITAFRFFSNAEPNLRQKGIKYLYEHLNDDGYIILNNHKNFWSIPFLISRFLFLSDGFGMTHKELNILLKKNNFKIIEYFSVGILTSLEKSKFIPWKLIELIENLFFKIFKGKHRLGYNVIYIIKKNDYKTTSI